MAAAKRKPAKRKASRGRRKAPDPVPSAAPTFGPPADDHPDVLPGKFYVRVHPEALRPHVGGPGGRGRAPAMAMGALGAAAAELVAASPAAINEPLAYLRENAGLKRVQPLFEQSGRSAVASANVRGRARDRLAMAATVATEETDELAGIALVELDPNAKESVLRHAASANAIDYIEPVPSRWLCAAAADPMQNLQWGLRAIKWFNAKRPDARRVRVGIADTGIDLAHPDFEGVELGYDQGGASARDIVGHGTHVAGIVGAATNNGAGIAGVASCAIEMWKIFGDRPAPDGRHYVDPDMFNDALRAATSAGLCAFNMSIGGPRSSNTEQILIRRLVESDVLPVAAMGNEFERGNRTMYPGAYAGVLAVGSIAETFTRSSFSNTGRHIGICAPGSNILSTLPFKVPTNGGESKYASWSGTSMATPHVAAAVALVAARDSSLDAAARGQHLQDTAAHLDAMGKAKRTQEYGSGLLDLEAALR